MSNFMKSVENLWLNSQRHVDKYVDYLFLIKHSHGKEQHDNVWYDTNIKHNSNHPEINWNI